MSEYILRLGVRCSCGGEGTLYRWEYTILICRVSQETWELRDEIKFPCLLGHPVVYTLKVREKT